MIGTVTSSVVPSGYVTTTTPLVAPFVVVVGGVCHSTLVFAGNGLSVVILVSAFGTTPLSTVCGTAVGLFSSFCFLTPTYTVNVLLSLPWLSVAFRVTV